MSTYTEQELIDRLDLTLTAKDSARVEPEIPQDAATDWAYLNLAVDTIGLGAIREKVAAARAAAKAEIPVVKMDGKEGAVVRSMFGRNAMRIAVAAVLILGVTTFYKYSVVTGSSVYNKSFTEYELGTVRGNGNETGDKMEEAYRSRNWTGVLTAFGKQGTKTNKSYFLAGMAQLEMKQYPLSVKYFETVLENNGKTGTNYFQAESEYYLALAYLMNNQTSKGVELIRKIRSDVYHPYYPLASKIPATDLKIVELKK